MDCYYLSLKPDVPANDYWAYGLLNDLISGRMWQPPGWRGFKSHQANKLPKTDRAIVVIPGEYHADVIDDVNKELSKIKHVVLFIMADEEGKFPVENINHSSIHIWVQFPWPVRHDDYDKLPTGYPGHIHEHLKEPEKSVDIFFAGQLTHRRRMEVMEGINEWSAQGNSADFEGTKGFRQGMEPEEYYKRLSAAKIAPAPAGTLTPDSFRAVEAMESMCMLIADNKNSQGTVENYWNWLFGEEAPFYKANEWDNLVGWCYEILENWPSNVHKQTAWWLKWKRGFAYRVLEQLNG